MVGESLGENAPVAEGIITKELTGFDLPTACLARHGQIRQSSAIAGMDALTTLTAEGTVGLSGDAGQGDDELLAQGVDLLTSQRRQRGRIRREHPLKVRNHQKCGRSRLDWHGWLKLEVQRQFR